MTLETLRRRLDRIERERGRVRLGKVLRIITEDDEDRDRQLAGLDLAGLFVIERRVIDPSPRSVSA